MQSFRVAQSTSPSKWIAWIAPARLLLTTRLGSLRPEPLELGVGVRPSGA